MRHVIRLLQTSAAEVVPPTKGNDQALAGEALKFERLEVQLLHFLNKPTFFGTADEFRLIAETGWKARVFLKQVEASLGHVNSPKGTAHCEDARPDALFPLASRL